MINAALITNEFYYLDNQYEYESSYDVFCLKSINNYSSIDGKLIIYKCDIITMEKNIIYSMNINKRLNQEINIKV